MKHLNLKNKVAQYREECISLYDGVEGVKTINDFVKRVEELSKAYDSDKLNTFKGDMLEIFSEIFFGAFKNTTDVGIREYNPIALDEDYGVDAIGINVNNDDCAIQVKYRFNPFDRIEYTDIAKTYTSARIRNKLSLENDNTVYLFTTANEITIACNEVFGKKLRVINRNVIAGKVDNNNSFWEEAQERIKLTFDHLCPSGSRPNSSK
jgi:hypothetical protein